MSAVILFEFPSARADARSWILDRAALLAIEGTAELKFVGIEQAGSDKAGSETIVLEFESVGRANSTLTEWRRDTGFPGRIETRLLEIKRIPLAGAIFP
jgi:hypothetical protein